MEIKYLEQSKSQLLTFFKETGADIILKPLNIVDLKGEKQFDNGIFKTTILLDVEVTVAFKIPDDRDNDIISD